MTHLKRAYVRTGGRWVHYRRQGAGPVIVILHGSPNSSLAMAPLMDVLSSDFDCIAIDTPGNGNSDPLPQDAPSTEDYAEALSETLDALSLNRVALYGFHTGAGTAAEFMSRYPARVSGAVLDGVAAWTEEEKAGMLKGYLPAFHPSWDGAHLTWLWSRVMEQTMFFPWHHPVRDARMNYDMPQPDVLHRTAMEFLRAGDHYRKPYAAALAGDGAARARRITTPCLITAHPLDPITHHLDRLSDLHEQVVVRKETEFDRETIWAGFREWFRNHPADSAPERDAPEPGGRARGFVQTSRGQLAYNVNVNGEGRPLLLLHDAGGSSQLFDPVITQADGKRPMIAFDLPGHGESGLTGAPLDDVEDFATAIAEALHQQNISRDAAAIGFHLGGQIAVELKRQKAISNVAIIGALHYEATEQAAHLAQYAPDLSVRWDGAHLLTAWRFIRMRALYDPWYERDRDHIFQEEPRLAPEIVHRQTVDLLKSENRHREAYAAQFNYPTIDRMNEASVFTVMTAPFDPMSADRRLSVLAARLESECNHLSLPAATNEWPAAFEAFAAET